MKPITPVPSGLSLHARERPSTGVGAPPPVVKTLANGARLVAIHLPGTQSASVGVFLRVGSRDETPQTSGIGHVLEHMAFKGTASRTVQQINFDAERLGADVNAFTGKDTTGYFMTGLGRHAEDFLKMTADIVLRSTFPEVELARELDVICQEAIEYAEDPQDRSSELLDQAIWGNHPMGMPVIGSLENIERFTRQDLLDHVRSHYVAGNTVVAAAGNFDTASFLALAEQLFAGMRRSADGAPPAPVVPAAYVGTAIGERFSQVSQVFLNIAYPLAPALPEEMQQPRWRVAASLAGILFGGGMSAPFTDTVREQRGLAYTADASAESGDAWCNFIVHAVTTPDKLDPLIAVTGELLRAQAQRIDPVHLERAKNQLTVSRVRSAERSYATMERAVEELFARGSITPMENTIALIETVTSEEVREVLERMLQHAPALAITGKGASSRAARQLAAKLVAATR